MDRLQRRVDHAGAINRRSGEPGGEYPADADQTFRCAEENYLLKEMGFRIARKHRRRLRRIARLGGFAVPAVGSLLALVLGGVAGEIVAGLGLASAALGLLAERWLFFAEAKHTVILYYGADAV